MHRWWLRFTTAAAFVAIVAAAAAAFAEPDTDRVAPAGRPGAEERRERRGHRMARMDRLVHGETKVRTDDGFETLVLDGGTVTAVDEAAKTLTLERADDVSVTVTATEQTRVRRDGERASFGDIAVGDRVVTLQVDQGEGPVLRKIRARSAGSGDGGAAAFQPFGLEGDGTEDVERAPRPGNLELPA